MSVYADMWLDEHALDGHGFHLPRFATPTFHYDRQYMAAVYADQWRYHREHPDQ